MSYINGCKMRVWDNGDTDDCGKPIFVSGLCKVHRDMVVTALKEEIVRWHSAIEKAERRLAELDNEEVNDTLALQRAL